MSSISKKRVDFSIIIPTYNRSKYLELAISSALRQKKVSFEIIVSDDCSTDDTESAVKSFGDKRIRYWKNKKRLGTSMNFQKCFLRSTGSYIFTLGDDDLILDEYSLKDVLTVMKKYKLGMGKIGTITYEETIYDPYQLFILSDTLVVLKPHKNNNILIKSIDFGLGYFSGLIFHNLRLDKHLLKLGHVCNSDHMCPIYHPAAFDLINKYGIGYIPEHFIVGHLSLQLIPTYYNIESLGRLFIEGQIEPVKKFTDYQGYESYKKEFLRQQAVLLPNIKLFSSNANYVRVIKRMIHLDKTLLFYPPFMFWGLIGFMPKFFIEAIRQVALYFLKSRVKDSVKKYRYNEKIEKLKYYASKYLSS